MNRLRDLREERNLTQEKVAKALGIVKQDILNMNVKK